MPSKHLIVTELKMWVRIPPEVQIVKILYLCEFLEQSYDEMEELKPQNSIFEYSRKIYKIDGG